MMKRLETLEREARQNLRSDRWTGPNGVDQMSIARALDKLADAEDVLRRAFDPENADAAIRRRSRARAGLL